MPTEPRPAMPPRWRARTALATLALAGAGLLGGCATLDEKQREWIFQPGARTWAGGQAAAQGMQDVWIDFHSAEAGQAARLHGLWLAQPQADAPVLLYLHGARFDVRGSAPRMRRLHELGFAVLAVDYRGFGQSTPALPSETLAHEDAQAAWRWLAAQHPQARRYLFGHSLGGAIAVRLAAETADVAGLMVEGSFTSIPDVVKNFEYGWLPLAPLITQCFDAAERIAAVKAPVLVVHGSADRLIPPALGQALFERATAPKRFVLVEGGSHHNTNSVGLAQYREAVAGLFGIGLRATSPGP
ncbi:alpha/beta hydrolase [Aquabacterium sp. OR-4]|uniref:alpha/beta hydrolase n=1 Tax=Aquabacterium sp. OR-4 TaxID=2978127 RepID=UPI0028CB10ED|nr:alpha/beta fold hydrolase [Aquabacterium sp. OR-4]MDT7834234.1 alpha/beta fold hydrolase [Aquabacterium sp. OR-4]